MVIREAEPAVFEETAERLPLPRGVAEGRRDETADALDAHEFAFDPVEEVVDERAHLTLTSFVQAFATLSSTDNRDAKALGLYNETAAADVTSSRSGISLANLGEPESFTTSKVIVVAVSSVIRMKSFRNGNSRVNFAPTAGLGLLGGRQRMIALKLK